MPIVVAGVVGCVAAFSSNAVAVNKNAHDKYMEYKKGSFENKMLSVTINNHDFNNTLHSDYLKYRVINLADIIANASYYTLTGYIRNHKTREFVFISSPPIDRKVIVFQKRKLIKLGRALKRTSDDDYKLAGDLLLQLSKAISKENVKEAERLISLFEDFYSDDLKIRKDIKSKDEAMLNDISNSIVGELKGVFSGLSSSIQGEAISALNLKNILGGRLF